MMVAANLRTGGYPGRAAKQQSGAYQMAPESAMGPTANGAIIVFHKLSHQSGLVLDGIFQAHSASAGFGIHLRTPVPPQLLDMRPIGTSPPSAS